MLASIWFLILAWILETFLFICDASLLVSWKLSAKVLAPSLLTCTDLPNSVKVLSNAKTFFNIALKLIPIASSCVLINLRPDSIPGNSLILFTIKTSLDLNFSNDVKYFSKSANLLSEFLFSSSNC